MVTSPETLPHDIAALQTALTAERAARQQAEARASGTEAMVAYLKRLLYRTISSQRVIASSLVRQQHVGWFAGASCEAITGFLRSARRRGQAPGDGPNKAGQLAGDRGCDDIGLLALAGELSIARTAAAAPVNRKLALALVGF